MLLSYVIPMYNVENDVIMCLESIYRQGLPINTFEVICIDDGSHDKTYDVVAAFGKEKNNLVLRKIQNSGQSVARNMGLEIAKGEYIYFVDSDDFLADGMLSNFLDRVVKRNADMVFVDYSEGPIETLSSTASHADYSDQEITDGRTYFLHNFVHNSLWTVLLRRNFLMENHLRFPEGRFCEDGMFMINCICHAETCTRYSVDVYRYVHRANSTVNNMNRDHQMKMIDDFEYTIDYLNQFIQDKSLQDNPDFLKALVDRRNGYTFFLQIRMIRAGVSVEKRKRILSHLEQIGCFPYDGINNAYGRRMQMLSKLIMNKPVFAMMCDFNHILKGCT